MKKLHPWFLAISMVALNTLDALLTAYLITKGVAGEGNPFMKYITDRSIWTFIAFKMAANIFIWWAAIHKRLVIRLVISLYSLYYLFLVIKEVSIFIQAYERNLL